MTVLKDNRDLESVDLESFDLESVDLESVDLERVEIESQAEICQRHECLDFCHKIKKTKQFLNLEQFWPR